MPMPRAVALSRKELSMIAFRSNPFALGVRALSCVSAPLSSSGRGDWRDARQLGYVEFVVGRWSAAEQVAPALVRSFAHLARREIHGRELVAPLERPAGVDEAAGVGVVLVLALRGCHHRIQRR